MSTVIDDDVLALAGRAFVATGRLDMGALADSAGINRSTLYRRCGGRDALIAAVIWRLAEPTLHTAYAGADGVGGERIADALGRFADSVVSLKPFADFVRREPERAMRLFTTRAGGVSNRIVSMIEDWVRAEVDAGTLTPVLPPRDTAYVLLRIAESFIYAEVLTGEEPEPMKVRQACGALLGVSRAGGE
ncbi:MAG: QsdR family transcriptional regulator [Gordonia sp. (in: high G+C Gram-positive bacteria)]|uniref:QsdR family transcriptional regulator n=1 Tax=Gordonia sp. (in: high G+C Gram-positive bacteria) TaxID=84139 RepID=UPI0039E41617